MGDKCLIIVSRRAKKKTTSIRRGWLVSRGRGVKVEGRPNPVVLLENTFDIALFVEPAANAIVCVGVLCPGIVSYSPVPASLLQLDLSGNQNCHLKGIKLLMEEYHAHTLPAILYRYSVEQRCLQMADPSGPRQETPGMKLYF